MRGMILAAGRGERMGHLTVTTPKPLLRVNNRYLIEYSIDALIKADIRDIVINLHYGKEQMQAALGDGSRYGARFYYSVEEERLETGGGIFHALPLLGDQPFIVLSADVISDYPLEKIIREPVGFAHLVLVSNPLFHPQGDFCLEESRVMRGATNPLTFANISVLRPELFVGCTSGHFRLGTLLCQAIADQQVTGEWFQGEWYNIGTAEQLMKLNKGE